MGLGIGFRVYNRAYRVYRVCGLWGLGFGFWETGAAPFLNPGARGGVSLAHGALAILVVVAIAHCRRDEIKESQAYLHGQAPPIHFK